MRVPARSLSKTPVWTTILILLTILLAGSANAQWSHDPTLNTTLSDPGTYGERHQSVSDGQGGVFSIWGTYDYANNAYDYRVQHTLGDGTQAWGSGVVVFATETSGELPQIVRDDMYGVYVALPRATSAGTLVYAQRLDSTGAKLWGTNGIQVRSFAALGTVQTEVQLIRDRNFGFVVGWLESNHIFLQRMDYNGNRLWGNEGYPTSSTSNKQGLVLTRGLNPGECFVGWEEYTANGDWDLKIQSLKSDGTNRWSGSTIDLATRSGDQQNLQLASNGVGDVIAVWQDFYGSSPKVYYQRKWSDGTNGYSSQYGVAFSGQYDTQDSPRLARDVDGNIFIAYLDYTANSAGRVAMSYAPSGANRAFPKTLIRKDYDPIDRLALGAGEGGSCYIAWNTALHSDEFSLHHFDSQGRSLWPENRGAFAVTSLAYDGGPTRMTLIPHQGEVIAAWNHSPSVGVYTTVRLQKIDHNGFMGDNNFDVTAAVDRPNDQGGEVTLRWDASPLDVPGTNAVANYSMWIKPVAKSNTAVAHGLPAEATLSDMDLGAYLNLETTTVAGLKSDGWTFAGQVPAMNDASYEAFCPTYGDSTSAGITYTYFRVVAHHQDSGIYWEPNWGFQGYSVDNLAPGAPLNLAGAAAAGTINLDWQASGSHDEDLARYQVYRGTVSGFALDANSLVGNSTGTTFQDPAPGGTVYYRVTALDAHGNESAPSGEVSVTSAVSAVGDAPAVFAHLGNYPNPFNPMTRISFSLPGNETVKVQVLDAAGRSVRVLVNETMAAGAHEVRWNGTDDSGRAVPSGVYFSLIEAGGESTARRMTLVR